MSILTLVRGRKRPSCLLIAILSLCQSHGSLVWMCGGCRYLFAYSVTYNKLCFSKQTNFIILLIKNPDSEKNALTSEQGLTLFV